MKVILGDIDDTLIDSFERTKTIAESILECEISMSDMLNLSLEQIFLKYADDSQKSHANELRQQFQDTMLCKNRKGIELMRLNKPILNAVSVLQQWFKQFKLIYLTGRLERIRALTFSELKQFGFPIQDSSLYMIEREDQVFKIPFSILRKEQLSLIINAYDSETVIRVIDDFPGYFPCYQEFSIPERYGYCHGNRNPQDFFKNGAIRVFTNWSDLI